MSKTAYRPRPDSLASQCIGFFRHNPDEVLSLEDIAEKFDGVRGNIHTLLSPALDACLLERKLDGEVGYLYSAGPDLVRWTPVDDAPATPATTAAPKPTARPRKMSPNNVLDFDNLKVEDGVPYVPHAAKGNSKWAPLFAKLKQPGQSTQIPGHMKTAVAAATYAQNKRKCGTFRVAMVNTTTARVWRLA